MTDAITKMTILFPRALYETIERLSEEQERSFSKQVIYMLKDTLTKGPEKETTDGKE